jgi:ABC-type glycerol-3-phosphate transport system permease component
MSKSLGAVKMPVSGAAIWKVFRPQWIRLTITTIILTIVALLWVYPFVWMLSASLKKPIELFSDGLGLIPKEWKWDNYVRAWQDAGFGRYMFNTVFLTFGTTFLALLQCTLTGYVLGRYNFIGKKAVFVVLIATLFVPTGYTIIPLVKLAEALGLLNSIFGMIAVMGGAGHTTSILLMTGYFNRLPKELEEAAVLDGAGFVTLFSRVMLPLARPIMATIILLTFLNSWNNFFIPLVFTFSQPDLRTLSVGMLAFVGQHSTDWSGMAAGATISLLPVMILFLFMQRYYVEGLAGAVKS